MASNEENFLSRWSRRKLESAREPAAASVPAVTEKPPELPPLESLSFESDFKAFMQAKIDEGVKRAALKKLFSDPRFNVIDGLDTYIDDYSKSDPVPDEMLERLAHAKRTLLGPDPAKEPAQPATEHDGAPPAQPPAPPEGNEDGAAG